MTKIRHERKSRVLCEYNSGESLEWFVSKIAVEVARKNAKVKHVFTLRTAHFPITADFSCKYEISGIEK